MKRKLTKLFFAAVAIFLVACGKGNNTKESKDSDKLQVVASFYPMYEMTSKVAGNRADVSVLVSGGAGAHSYEPSAKDIAKLSEADVFVYNSDQMEFWVASMLDTVENDDLKVVKTSTPEDMIAEDEHDHDHEDEHDHDHEEEHDHDHEDEHDHDHEEEHDHDHEDEHDHDHDHEGHDHGGVDPHNWLDPQQVIRQVDVIKEALIKADPEGKEEYEKNADEFKKELEAVDNEYEEAFKDAKSRVIVVQHKAFGYLAHRYQLEQVAATGVNTEAEPTAQKIAEINQIVKETKVPVIYYQSGANSKVAETIAEETGTEVAVLYDLERAPKDVEGTEKEMNFIDAMRYNLEQLKKSVK